MVFRTSTGVMTEPLNSLTVTERSLSLEIASEGRAV